LYIFQLPAITILRTISLSPCPYNAINSLKL
jgi:hypothetical protein